jgi:Mg-chelatase subunit ChlD
VNTQYQIVPGSISSLAKQNNRSIAESFINVDYVILVDTSGSMATKDSRGGRSRYKVASDELAALQQSLPGKIAVISFSDDVQFCPSGTPVNFNGGTRMDKALSFAKIADVPGMQFFLISDGQPDDPQNTLRIAQTFQNKINVIYVGPEANPTGRDFLERLAAATGGQSITIDRAKELKAGIERLLLGSKP